MSDLIFVLIHLNHVKEWWKLREADQQSLTTWCQFCKQTINYSHQPFQSVTSPLKNNGFTMIVSTRRFHCFSFYNILYASKFKQKKYYN